VIQTFKILFLLWCTLCWDNINQLDFALIILKAKALGLCLAVGACGLLAYPASDASGTEVM